MTRFESNSADTDETASRGEFVVGEATEQSVSWVSFLPFLVPPALAILVLLTSPNYRQIEGIRPIAFGGDFVQEWVGGLVARTSPEQIYDLGYVRSVQHDPSQVGFSWPDDQYFPMVYPPFYYQAMSLFSYLNFPVASRVWVIFCGFAVTICGFLLSRYYPRCRKTLGVGMFASVVFVPLLLCLAMGQKSTWILLILSSTFLLLHHHRPFSGGLVFGLIAFKPHLGLVIGLAMLLKGHWKFAIGAVSTVAVLVGVSWVKNPKAWVDYLSVVSSMGDYVQSGGYQLADSHSLWGACQLSFSFVSATMVKVITVVCGIVVLGLLYRILKHRYDLSSTQFSVQYSAMVLATVMLSPHFYTYDLVILLLPMLLVVSSYETAQWKATRVDQIVCLSMLGLFAMTGMFPKIADVIRVQPSISVMVLILAVLPKISAMRDEAEKPMVVTSD
jgi:hypothetical protein